MPPDRGLFISLTAVLAGLGVLMVYSASITSWPTDFEQVYLSRHLVFLLIGSTAAAVAAKLPVTFWRRITPGLFAVTVLLLVLVLIPGVGTSVNGARRWLRIGPLSLQPSELAKMTLPLMLALLLATRSREQLRRPLAGTVPFLLPVACVLPLVLIEPDLGDLSRRRRGCRIGRGGLAGAELRHLRRAGRTGGDVHRGLETVSNAADRRFSRRVE